MDRDGDFEEEYSDSRARPSAAGALVILGAILVLIALLVTMVVRKIFAPPKKDPGAQGVYLSQ